jgi:hypothetical protein
MIRGKNKKKQKAKENTTQKRNAQTLEFGLHATKSQPQNSNATPAREGMPYNFKPPVGSVEAVVQEAHRRSRPRAMQHELVALAVLVFRECAMVQHHSQEEHRNACDVICLSLGFCMVGEGVV